MNYYEILGVLPSATTQEIRKAYRQRSKECHPDTGGSEVAMKALNEAWTCLRDPTSRAEYERSLTRGRVEEPGAGRLHMEDLDRMSSAEAQSAFMALFHAMGCAVAPVPGRPNGYDFAITRTSGETFVVRLSIWQGDQPVQAMDVTHCVAGAMAAGAGGAWVISNRPFTEEAAEAADRLGAVWFDRQRLVKFLDNIFEPAEPSADGVKDAQAENEPSGDTAPSGNHTRPWWSHVEPSWLATAAAVAFFLLSIITADANGGSRKSSDGSSSRASPSSYSTSSSPRSTPAAAAPTYSLPPLSVTPTAEVPPPTTSTPPTSTTTAPGVAASSANGAPASTGTPAVTESSSATSTSSAPAPHSNSPPHFTLGSTKEDVRAVMGSPDSINVYPALDKEDWSYGNSEVTFDNDGSVKEWNNRGNLKVQLPISATASSFTMGSTKETVLAAMGTPTAIRKYPALDKEDWSYNYSEVTFSNAGVIKEWSNRGNLKVVLLPSSNAGNPDSFTVGSTKDEVLAVMGTPAAIRKYPALDKEDWSYGYSGVTFNNGGRVKEWSNRGNLKVR